jgi:hypothetical protein
LLTSANVKPRRYAPDLAASSSHSTRSTRAPPPRPLGPTSERPTAYCFGASSSTAGGPRRARDEPFL